MRLWERLGLADQNSLQFLFFIFEIVLKLHDLGGFQASKLLKNYTY
jgi:hypothetical protein